ncbi:hypothetical protein CcaCcLH18_02865 [Colletotrichum camelliae]|nr:hypothetical protein CcaCcLH18_02865 [Colletotrichum camelliae]
MVTANGRPTVYSPLPTPWPMNSDCASRTYRQSDDGPIIAWDPYFGMNIDSKAATCFPAAVTSWWFQTVSQATSIALGPTFECPQLYTAAQTLLEAGGVQHVFCCPSDYSFNVPQPNRPVFPSQCLSMATPGQTITYDSLTIGTNGAIAKRTTSVVNSAEVTIWAVPVNGYNFPASSTSPLAAEPAQYGVLDPALSAPIDMNAEETPLSDETQEPILSSPAVIDIEDTSPPDDDIEPEISASVNSTAGDRPLVVYAYSESDNARANLRFFITKGLNNAADFVFIFNGDSGAARMVPRKPNVTIVKRDNTCFDLGAIGEVLRKHNLWRRYKRFITMNASIRGPFLPWWSKSCWTDLYLDKITDTTKSMILATDDVGMGILLDPAFALSASQDDEFGSKETPVGLSGCYADWNAAVHAEIGTTGLILKAGYKVDAMMTAAHTVMGGIEAYCEATGAGDILFDKEYFGMNIHPYETVFIKANRDVDPWVLDSMTEWHLKMNPRGSDACGA